MDFIGVPFPMHSITDMDGYAVGEKSHDGSAHGGVFRADQHGKSLGIPMVLTVILFIVSTAERGQQNEGASKRGQENEKRSADQDGFHRESPLTY
jgi:hypothetical protein